jgi:TPR repeat protein
MLSMDKFMKPIFIASALFFSSIFLTGCFSNSYDDGKKAYQDNDFAKAKEIWVDVAQKQGNDNAMYSLYNLGHDHPEVMPLEESIGWLQQAADAGRPDAQYEYGLFLAQRDHFAKAYDYLDKAATWKEERAIKLLDQYYKIREDQILAEKGDPKGMYKYAVWLLNSDDSKKREEGVTWARKSAIEGDHEGEALYATILYQRNDYSNAQTWFSKAARAGNNVAEYYLGIMKIQGKGSVRNSAQGIEYLKRAAYKNNMLACFELGRMYINGDATVALDVTQKQAIDWISQAASQNMIEAQYILAFLYENGIGVKQDYTRAMSLYKLAAEHDHIKSKTKLGELYIVHGSEKQKKDGVEILKQTIDQNNSAEAKTFLGYAYNKGLGVNQDFDQAYYWYKAAADVDVATAQFNLAVMIANGHGEKKDLKKVTFWIDQAAHNGLPDAMMALCIMYERGIGVPRNTQNAKFWCKKANENGNTNKKEIAELLSF